jgi:hypothetical protein
MQTIYYVRTTLADGGTICSRAFRSATEADTWALLARRCPDALRVEIITKTVRQPAA